LEKADWHPTQIVRENAGEFVAQLKQGQGRDIAIFGSASLAASLMPLGLIDELRLIVSPIILGNGTPLFQEMTNRVDLDLVRTRVFRNGNVLLVYRYV
jgi:dihydrofolate reductase